MNLVNFLLNDPISKENIKNFFYLFLVPTKLSLDLKLYDGSFSLIIHGNFRWDILVTFFSIGGCLKMTFDYYELLMIIGRLFYHSYRVLPIDTLKPIIRGRPYNAIF
jgi:hypothetical protein